MDIHNNKSMATRENFLTYFRKNKHRFMPQIKVYSDDPTLFFTTAGVVPLKKIFMGEQEPKPGYTRLMNWQICIRAGGKHNDLDDVGFDSTHLTLFEMLGNWSLNDYGKEEAIDLAYRFIVDECKLDLNRLYVTYFEGNDVIPEDTESKEIWKKYMPENRILKGNFKDNFWAMGDMGPCGPSSEIHYDLVGNRFIPELINNDDPTVIELWNLVFTTYNKDKDGYHDLGKMWLDTGAGCERICMVLQNKPTIYQTDSFRYLAGYAQAITNAEPFQDKYDGNMLDVAYRIFMDHMRTTVICLHQGVDFDCNKRGHILRKIFKRMLTYLYLYLNNYHVRRVMSHLAVRAAITDILNFFLEKTHDGDKIWQQMIEEEKLYTGSLIFVQQKYRNSMKKLKDHNLVVNKLKTEDGISQEIIDNLDKLVIEQ